ncbi:Non-hem dioxygenase N-terminal domain-containing protein [Hirschfeldia incana]|nr:Non-hem dioxygenase N-terminal domain-containing protein [Hirschfeldia incana]
MEFADRCIQAKAFDQTQAGVKGLADSGITEIPAMFRAPLSALTSLKPPPSQLTIPTVDLNGGSLCHKKQDMQRRSVVEKIGEASEKWGFFQVINHGIPLEVLEKMLQGIRAFHEQDSDAKKRFYTRDFSNDIYYASNFDLYTSQGASWRDTVGCYTAPDPPRLENLPAVCGEIMMEFSKHMKALGELLFELLSEALGLNSSYLKDIDCAKSQVMFCQYYPPCPQPDLTLGLSKHTDFSFLTVLLQDNIGGLQVLHDKTWIDVPPVPGALVVNIGDLLQLITNDKFISAEHRVVANGASVPRISAPCFFSTFMKANPHVYGPIKELLSEENPAKYRELTINEFADIFRSKTISAPALHHFRI